MTQQTTSRSADDGSSAHTFRKGRHLTGTETASDVLTDKVRMVKVHADRINPLREILLVSGKQGLGKTFALRHYLDTTEIPYVLLALTDGATGKEVLSRLYTLLTNHTLRAEAWVLRDELRDILAEQQRIVVIDECANLSTGALNTLRSLHDEDTANFSLYFCGTAAEQITSRIPALGDRIGGHVAFQPYGQKQMFEHLQAYHPLFAQTPAPVLQYLFKDYAGGRFRRWARILQVALPLLDRRGQGPLDDKLAAVILKAIKLPSTRAERNGAFDREAAGLTPTPVAHLVAASLGTSLTNADADADAVTGRRDESA